jgi:hypothetical protein
MSVKSGVSTTPHSVMSNPEVQHQRGHRFKTRRWRIKYYQRMDIHGDCVGHGVWKNDEWRLRTRKMMRVVQTIEISDRSQTETRRNRMSLNYLTWFFFDNVFWTLSEFCSYFFFSEVQLPQSTRKSKVDSILTKSVVLRVNLNIDGVPIVSRSHTHPSHFQTSRLLTSFLSLGVPVPRTNQCMWDV